MANAPEASDMAVASPAGVDALARPLAPIDLDLVAALPSLPLRARYLVESFLTGRHRSPIKGTAPEFAEYRSYQPGDDLRRIDWRLYGRFDRLSVKQFEDENQMRICLALDVSASLRYASQPRLLSKADFARTLLAAITLLARRQHDAVGLALLGDTGSERDGSLRDYLRPASSPAQQHAVFRRLEEPPATRTVSLPDGLRRLSGLLSRGGVLVLASDFYTDLTALEDMLRQLRAQRVEIIGLQVLDPMEVEFSTNTSGLFVDLENGHRLPLNTAACRKGYLERFGAFQRQLADIFRQQSADLVVMRTDENPCAGLAAYLARRARVDR
jgi:uncharacterized protein (DUF58 family)